MNDYTSRQKKNREFASKKAGAFHLHSLLDSHYAFWLSAHRHGNDSEAGPYIVMGSLLALVCGSLGLCRKKIIQQDKAIRLLQERLDEVSGMAD